MKKRGQKGWKKKREEKIYECRMSKTNNVNKYTRFKETHVANIWKFPGKFNQNLYKSQVLFKSKILQKNLIVFVIKISSKFFILRQIFFSKFKKKISMISFQIFETT